jgi:hypothetical protein
MPRDRHGDMAAGARRVRPDRGAVIRRKAEARMSTDPEAAVCDWSDAILHHDIDECVSLMAEDFKRYGDPSWEYPVRRTSECSGPEFSYHAGRSRMAPSITTSGQAGGQSETSAGGVPCVGTTGVRRHGTLLSEGV